jgi:chemotaxis methyl-accepting protein methylase
MQIHERPPFISAKLVTGGQLARGGYLVVGPTEGIFGMLGPLTKHKTWLYQKPG